MCVLAGASMLAGEGAVFVRLLALSLRHACLFGGIMVGGVSLFALIVGVNP